MPKLERRFLAAEVRAAGDNSPKITGYAAKFDQRSQDLGGFVEIIAPGAFDACLASNPDILGLFNHDMNQVLGRTSSGTMRVSVDATGLRYEIDPPETQLGRDLPVLMRRGDIRGSSFGFYPVKDEWTYDRVNDLLIRMLITCDVFDCSVVTNPAYLSSDSSVRAQLPEGDDTLRALVTEKRQALTASPVISDDDRWRLQKQLELLNML